MRSSKPQPLLQRPIGLAIGLALGVALAAVLLWVLLRSPGWPALWDSICRARPTWVLAAVLSVLLTTASKVARWHVLFPQGRRPGILALARSLVIGQLTNALLLARLGGLTRAYVLERTAMMGTGMTLGTIAVEKALDLSFLLATVLLVTGLRLFAGGWNDAILLLSAVGLLFVVSVLLWPERRLQARLDQLGDRFPGRMSAWWLAFVRQVLSGLRALCSWRQRALAVAWSLWIWVLAASTNYLLFRAFSLHLAPGVALLLLAVLHAGVAPPSTPGRVGVFHALVVLTLTSQGVDRERSLACGTVLHAVVYGPQLALGLVALVTGRLQRRTS